MLENSFAGSSVGFCRGSRVEDKMSRVEGKMSMVQKYVWKLVFPPF